LKKVLPVMIIFRLDSVPIYRLKERVPSSFIYTLKDSGVKGK